MKRYFSTRGILTNEEYEAALGRWYSLGMLGCGETERGDGTVEVTAYFTTAEAAREAASRMRRGGGDGNAVTEVADEDWNARWRESMQPALLAPKWWVAPQWLTPPSEPGDHWIKIEPKMAFGTGHHETTRLAANAIIALEPSQHRSSLLDIGTGSGILCFISARCGINRSIGIEIDRECRENLAENRALNSSADHCSFIIGPVDVFKNDARFDVIVMNMIHTESAPLLDQCHTLTAGGGTLIWSGILRDEKRPAIDAAREAGFDLCGESAENEWWCGTFRRGPRPVQPGRPGPGPENRTSDHNTPSTGI